MFCGAKQRLRKCLSQQSDLFTVACNECCSCDRIIATCMWYEIYCIIIAAKCTTYSLFCNMVAYTLVGHRWLCTVLQSQPHYGVT